MKLIGAGFIVAGAICAGTSFLDKPGFLQKTRFLENN
jgi:hypothetical protein